MKFVNMIANKSYKCLCLIKKCMWVYYFCAEQRDQILSKQKAEKEKLKQLREKVTLLIYILAPFL